MVPGGIPQCLLQLRRPLGIPGSEQGTAIALCVLPVLTAYPRPQTAIIYEADEPGQHEYISYGELLREVSRLANVLKGFGVRKGDTVTVYMPMAWQAVAAFLACARIGALHSVVFPGFSSAALRDRINDCRSRVVLTADESRRAGKAIALKALADAALEGCPHVEHVLVLRHTGNEGVGWVEGRDKWWHEEAAKVPNYCPPALLNSEDGLFILYVGAPALPCRAQC